MYHRILVPLDGSELAETALPYAKNLAAQLGLEMVLLHVASKGEAESLPLHRAYIDQVVTRLKGQVALHEKAGANPATVKGEVIVGYAADEILHYADEKEIDLIVMATHGRSGIRRWVMGNVADKILRSSTPPVLLVRSNTSRDVDHERWIDIKLLVPLDGSELAELVLPHVEALASPEHGIAAEVILVRVCEPLVVPPVATPETSGNWADLAEQYLVRSRKSAEEYLARVQKVLSNIGLKVGREILVGDPATEIIEYAEKNPSNLIVMATHGRSGLGRWVYGSVTQKVLHGASNPILLIRPPSTFSIVPKIVVAIRNLPPI